MEYWVSVSCLAEGKTYDDAIQAVQGALGDADLSYFEVNHREPEQHRDNHARLVYIQGWREAMTEARGGDWSNEEPEMHPPTGLYSDVKRHDPNQDVHVW